MGEAVSGRQDGEGHAGPNSDKPGRVGPAADARAFKREVNEARRPRTAPRCWLPGVPAGPSAR
ncbi:hypothetical protein ABZ916_44670, partial [Streptomyces sp. NPDC046853]|uniref:hypothetical protein n=1 Tax=Streptomyces sp. NPDC046853 TaxID=3154920 RepID=UPI0033ECE2D7